MKKLTFLLFFALCSLNSKATDYTTWLTSARGFTEVTSASGLLTGDYYYAICSAENSGLIVGVCPAGDRKAGWAPDNSLAMCYVSASTDPILNRKNFWIIEKSGNYIGLRNLHHNVCFFQTNDNEGYLWFAGFYYEHSIDEWCYLTPTYQNGYWMFESGKYPISGGNWASGYMGPWGNRVYAGETMAMNRKNTGDDLAGHFRIFRIAKSTYESLYNTQKAAKIAAPVAGQPVDYTSKITNPSFETGDVTGWTVTPSDGSDVGARTYTLTGMEGTYVGNFFTWWGNVSIEQTVSNLPAGTYKISAIMGTWAQRYTMGFSVNGNIINRKGTGADNGIPVSQTLTLTGSSNSITIKAFQNADWWSTGRGGDNSGGLGTDECGFFKIDDIRLTYYSSIPALPNNETTVLTPDTWYYYDAPASARYILTGNLSGIVYADDLPDTETLGNQTKSEMGFPAGRIYFKTTRSDATLKVEPANTASSFTACTLNVDGLPTSILLVTINADGPGSSGTKLISTYLNNKGYDICAFEEDFNYNTELKQNISGYTWGTHGGSVSSLSNSTDGLQFATKNSTASFTGESRTAFTKTTSTDGNQYITKGFRYYEVTLASGDKIDVFITHMDAGDNAATQSRPSQLQQIANAILSKGNTSRPKIFMGDTNCRWTREDIRTNFVNILSGTYDVKDAWAELVRGGDYPTPGVDPTQDNEVVDKILYINPQGTGVKKIIPYSYSRDEEGYVNSSGDPLGDHAPIVVSFGIGTYEEVDNTVTWPAGDVTLNDDVTLSDVPTLVEVLLDNREVNQACYVNDDNSVNISDLDALIQLLMNK